MDTAQALFDQGRELAEQGKLDEALNAFNALLNRKISSPELLYMISSCMIRKGWNGAAINLLGVALQKHPDFAPGWCDIGVAFRCITFPD